jgi:hypothetical protein
MSTAMVLHKDVQAHIRDLVQKAEEAQTKPTA